LRQVARDGQAQAGAAEAPAGAAIGLAERLEDHLGLFPGDADAGVAHREAHASLAAGLDLQRYRAVLGELDRVGQQVLQDLLQALAVGHELRRRVRGRFHAQLQALLLRQRLEGLAQAGEHGAGVQGLVDQLHVAGLDP
jgi:hypothetical protein